MVGVPRSKTCFRCLNKRKRCDSRRPGCSQCEEKGLECPGYRARFRFVASSGLANQQLNDEVCIPPTTSAVQATLIRSNDPALEDTLNRSLEGTASHIELLARFHDVYYPRRRISCRPLPTDIHDLPSWEWILLSLKSSQGVPLLRDVVLALVLGCIGKHDSNTVYLQRGLYMHDQAVKQLKKQLQDERNRSSDDMLAAVMVFGIYEIQVGSYNRGKAWLAHVHGIDALLQLREGSEDPTPLAKQLIWASQYNRWVIAMRTRRITNLIVLQRTAKEWLPPDVQLFEILQWVAPLIGKADHFLEIHESCCAHQRSQIAASLLSEIDILVAQLNEWGDNLSTGPECTVFWNEPSILQPSQRYTAVDLDGFETMLCFPSIRLGTSLLFCWTGLLFLHTTKDLLNSITTQGAVLAPCANETALRIARSFEYFLHPDIGLFGTYLIGFPLGVCRAYLEQHNMTEILWLEVIESRVKEVGSGLCDFLKDVRSDDLLPRMSRGTQVPDFAYQ